MTWKQRGYFLLQNSRTSKSYTVIDSQVRVQQIELTAQIHGMFFLSELATPSGESHLGLTCYRRNCSRSLEALSYHETLCQ